MQLQLETTASRHALHEYFTKKSGLTSDPSCTVYMVRAIASFLYGLKMFSDLVELLLSATNENLTQTYCTRVLYFFNKLFQMGEIHVLDTVELQSVERYNSSCSLQPRDFPTNWRCEICVAHSVVSRSSSLRSCSSG